VADITVQVTSPGLSLWGRDTWGYLAWSNQTQVSTTSGQVTAYNNSGWGRDYWGQLSYGVDFVNAESTVSGISLSTTLGTVSINGEINLGWGRLTWGENAWGAAGDVLATGQSLSTTLGTITIDAKVEQGWGRGGWGNRVWGDTYSVLATGQQATTAIGTAIGKTDVNVSVTGLDLLTITQGLSSIQIDNNVFVFASEDQLDTAIGTVPSVTGTATVDVTNSAPNFQFTAQGNAALSTDQAKFGPSSLELDGTDDIVDTTTNLDLSSTDFTIDVWIRPNSVSGYKGIWQSGTSTTEQSYLLGSTVYWTVNPSTIITTAVTVNANEWTMLSYEREGNTHRIYKNGTLADTASTGNRPDTGIFSIGESGFGDFNGYIDEFRVSNIARYGGSSFTEPTEAFTFDSNTQFLLHFDGPDGSTVIKSADDTLFQGTLSVDQVVPEPLLEVPVTGISATLTLGNITLIQSTNETVTGQSVTLSLGTVDAVAVYPVTTAGLLNGSVGSVTVTGTANINVTGVGLTASIGSINITPWNEIDLGVNNVWTEVDLAA
jgi:hypothetical protein